MSRSLGFFGSIPAPRRKFVCAQILLGTAIACFVGSQGVSAQNCASPSPLGWMAGLTPGTDGLIHASVNYSGGSTAPTSTVKGLMEGAVAAWNNYKCATGVVFEEG